MERLRKREYERYGDNYHQPERAQKVSGIYGLGNDYDHNTGIANRTLKPILNGCQNKYPIIEI
jgi:hypothetical protein